MATQNLKDAVGVIINLAQAVETSTKDGFQITDIFAFIPALSALPALLKNKGAIKSEFDALDRTGKEELFAYATSTYKTSNEKTEAIIEAGFDLILTGALFVKAIK